MLVGKGRGELGGQRGAVRWGVKTSQHQHSEEEIQHGRRRSLSSSEETSGEEKEKLRRKLQNWRRFHAVQQKQCGRKTVDKLSELQQPPEIFPQEVFSRNLFLCTTVLKKKQKFLHGTVSFNPPDNVYLTAVCSKTISQSHMATSCSSATPLPGERRVTKCSRRSNSDRCLSASAVRMTKGRRVQRKTHFDHLLIHFQSFPSGLFIVIVPFLDNFFFKNYSFLDPPPFHCWELSI